MRQHLLSILGCSLALLSCSRDSDDAATPTTPGSPTSPVETNAPNANYSPAFAGQTRASGVTTAASSYRAAVITSALTSPWGIGPLHQTRS